jgi:hypothetical protein
LPDEALEILEIYNNISRARVFPDDWKKYTVECSLSVKTTNDKHAHMLVARKELEILRNTIWISAKQGLHRQSSNTND